MLPDDEGQFRKILRKYGRHRCPGCKKLLSLGDCAWNWGCTEYGTDYNVTEIQCQACQTEVMYYHDWYPTTDYPEKFYEILEKHLEREQRDKLQQEKWEKMQKEIREREEKRRQ